MMTDISVTIGGDAGQGIESSGAALTRALMRAGWHVFSMVDYRSRIRGGHNFYQARAADRRLHGHSDPVHVLLAMTEETVKVHLDNVAEGGAVVYDQDFRRVERDEIEGHGLLAFPAPLSSLASEHGRKVMMNTAALGVAMGLLDVPARHLEGVLGDTFADKGGKVADANTRVLEAAHGWALERRGDFRYRLGEGALEHERMAVHGNHALALGALAGGCRFLAAYPMTPGTSLFEYVARTGQRTGAVVKHAESEIAAACMIVGAAHAGARAMTATSGGGFSLMSEALGMAGMVELPVVVVLAQRGGPSTGLPTRTEQGDLLFAINASQGEFPRVVLAPGTIEGCFEAGSRAFNLAETYQCPVIVMSDQFLASSLRDLPPDTLNLDDVRVERGQTLAGADLDGLEEPYLRFRDTPDGISPRALPGHPGAVYALTTDEHDEESHISEEIGNRRRQMAKRMRKLEPAGREMRGPTRYGPEDAELTLICWGSTYGPCREAVEMSRAAETAGPSLNLLHFADLWPFPAKQARDALAGVRRGLAVEQNYTSQFARLLRMTTGYEVDGTLNKYDGRPFSLQDVLSGVEREVPARV